MKYPLILALSLTFSFQAYAQTYTGPKEDIEQILANAAQFSQYIMDADYDNIMASYTDDAKLFPRNTDIMVGQEKIRTYWILPEGVHTSHHKVTSLEIKVIGDEAYDYGYYEGITTRDDGGISTWQGKYVIVWKKVDGVWKMYLDIWNNMNK